MRIPVYPTVIACISTAGCFANTSVDGAASHGAPTKSAAVSQPAPRGETAQDRDYVDPDGIVRRGEAMSTGPSLSVASIMDKAQDLDGKLVKVTGTVGKVCSKSGCWFELKGDSEKPGIRITSKGYRFFVPSKANGMTAVLEGDLKVRMLDIATAQHYADDAAEGTGQPAERVTAPVPEVSIAAVGLEMHKPNKDG